MTTHAEHPASFEPTCPTCWGRVKSDNVTLADPLHVDEEPWAVALPEPDPRLAGTEYGPLPAADDDRGLWVGVAMLLVVAVLAFLAGRVTA